MAKFGEKTNHGGGGPKWDPDPEEVVSALREAVGIKAVAARRLGISRNTLYVYLRAHPSLLEEVASLEEEMKDLAEGKMIAAIKRGDGQMIRWYLDRKAKERGYGHTTEVSGPKGGPVPMEARLSFDPAKLSTDALREIAMASMENPDDGDAG